MRNITVDEGDVKYFPPQCNGAGWTVDDSDGHDGSYKWCAGPAEIKASFTFTGVAVYVIGPTATSGQSMEYTLDGVPSGNVPSPLRGHSNTPRTSIIWWETGLEYTQHTLELSPGEIGTRISVDAFMYTVPDDSSFISKIRPVFAISAAKEPEATRNRAIIIVGSILGFFILSTFLAISLHLYKRSKTRSQYVRKAPIPPLPLSDKVTSQDSSGNTTKLALVAGRTDSPPVDDAHRHYNNYPTRVEPNSRSYYPDDVTVPPRAISKPRTLGREDDYELAQLQHAPARQPSLVSSAYTGYQPQHPQPRYAVTSSPQRVVSPMSVTSHAQTEYSATPLLKLEPNRRNT